MTSIQKYIIPGCIVLLFTACGTSRQSVSIRYRYQPAAILAKADSIVASLYGERIFKKHIERLPLNLYDYKPRADSEKEKTAELSRFNYKRNCCEVSECLTKGYFCGAAIMYHIHLKEKDFEYYSIDMIFFDAKLNSKEDPPFSLTRLPQYVLNNDTCNFISRAKAIEIARKYFEEPIGVKRISISQKNAEMKYSIVHEKYYWQVSLLLTEWDDYAEVTGIAEIDALTGKMMATRREKAPENNY